MIHECRLHKEPEELELMRRAAAISAQAHQRAMREARGGMMEWEVEALIDFTFRKNGAAGPSYPSIVASAGNAAVLHYISNDREMKTGDLLLIDAGCEYQFYASDVTRTFPVGAKFSPLQKSLYEIVLAAQMKAIEVIKPGVRFDDPHDAALRILVDGMRDLGLLHRLGGGNYFERIVSPLLHASHQPLARHGCARCRHLSAGCAIARARAGDGADGRAGDLHRAR